MYLMWLKWKQYDETQQAVSDLSTILLDVVADKTGYPAEMLNLEMHLDSDLGIDSIKRVEILSALQDKMPNLTGRCRR